MQKLQKQHNIRNFQDLYCGYLQRFIDEFDFADVHSPKARHFDEEFDLENFGLEEWRSDILVDSEYNLYLPSHYSITNYQDDSYSDADTGHNLVSDVTFDSNPEYEGNYKIDFKECILPWILETMREDDHPAWTEYVNVMTNKN